jgi:glc operon protein GlcG
MKMNVGTFRVAAICALSTMVLAVTALAREPTGASAQAIVQRPALSADGAASILEACRAFAKQKSWHVTIAVVDSGGALMAFLRMDNTSLNAIHSALEKAKTAATIGQSTAELSDRVVKSSTPEQSVLIAEQQRAMGFYAAPGGLPIVVNSTLVGAIGVSGEPGPGGVPSGQDEQCAHAGLDAGLREIALKDRGERQNRVEILTDGQRRVTR